MEKSDNKHNKIELRSEKVRKLIGVIPSSLERWGIVVIAIVFIALLAAVYFLPYPYSPEITILQHLLQ